LTSFRQLKIDLHFLTFADVQVKEEDVKDDKTNNVVVMSYPRYCRYRGMAKRLEGKPWVHTALIVALGGLADPPEDTAVLFCRDNFDYPELETHELLCNHLGLLLKIFCRLDTNFWNLLAPKFAGRPRKKKWRNSSPGSDSNESDGSSYSVESIGKVCFCICTFYLFKVFYPLIRSRDLD
jgi:hypothetical protein